MGDNIMTKSDDDDDAEVKKGGEEKKTMEMMPDRAEGAKEKCVHVLGVLIVQN